MEESKQSHQPNLRFAENKILELTELSHKYFTDDPIQQIAKELFLDYIFLLMNELFSDHMISHQNGQAESLWSRR